VTTHGHVAGSQRRTIDGLREANAGLCRENQEWQDKCLAMQTERDEWRTIAEELRSKLDEVARLYNSIRAERDAALGRLAVMTFGPEYIHSLAEEP